MGLANQDPTSPTDDSHSEETLPLYTSHLDITEPALLELPDSSATPDEVRDFLIQVLAGKRRLPLDHARRTASRWNTGSGRELRTYSPAMFLSIFGPEDGWLLYKDVKMLEHEAKMKRSAWNRYGGRIWLSFSAIFELIVVLIAIFGGHIVAVWIASLFLSIAGAMNLGMTILIIATDQGHEKHIEDELRKAWTAPSQPNQSQ